MRLLLAMTACFLVSALAAPARGDVVILKGNDVPLTGRIVKEGEDYVRFQIKGLGKTSSVDIEKCRIVRFWREENTYWEYLQAERERRELLYRLKTAAPPEVSPGVKNDATSAPTAPAPGRTRPEVRRDFLLRALDRLVAAIPEHPVLRILCLIGLYLAVALLLYAGSRVADLPRLRFGRAAILALLTLFFVVLGFFASGNRMKPESFPLVVSGEVVAWVLVSRMLAGGAIAKSVLLLSFFVSSLFLLGASLFSVLAAL